MNQSREDIKNLILTQAIKLSQFEGWTESMLAHAAQNSGFSTLTGARIFPEGVAELVEYFSKAADHNMLENIDLDMLSTLRIRDKIAYLVMLRLRFMADKRESLRRAIGFSSLPQNALRGMRSVYKTVDDIWYAAGDNATDFNYYSKRFLLAQVYVSSSLVFLDDASENFTQTEEFLRRRIDNVMNINKIKAKMSSFKMSSPLKAAANRN